MDLLDFDTTSLYFDEPLPTEAARLLEQAGREYSHEQSSERSELLLLRAHLIAPSHLAVLVALYRFYYYRHRLDETLRLAHQTLGVAGRALEFPADWRQVEEQHLHRALVRLPMGLVRFYLSSLKAAGYLNLRLRRFDAARDQLRKVITLDSADRLGAGALLDLIERTPRAV